MKRFLFLISLFCLSSAMQAQERKHTTFYDQRATLFETLPTSKDDIIFLGNSITNGCEWAELLGNAHAKNRGISGDTTNGVLDRLHVITAGKPSKVFLLIGINDLSGGLRLYSEEHRDDCEAHKEGVACHTRLLAERTASQSCIQYVHRSHEASG